MSFEGELARALALALDLDGHVLAGGSQAGVGEPDAELDRLTALIAAPVGLDLGLPLADQSDRAMKRIVWTQNRPK